MSRTMLVLMIFSLGAAALLGGCSPPAADQRPPNENATLILDFTPNAVHAGIYSAVARGYDANEGVKLHVREPSASTDSVKLLLAGRAQFAILDIHDLAIAAAKGRDLVGVMALVQRPLAAVLAGPSVKSPRALQGKKAGVTGLPSDDAVLRSVVTGAGGNAARVSAVTIGFDAVPDLLSGRVSGATAFWNVEGVALQRKRSGFHSFRVDDFGAPAYPELVLTTTRKTLRSDPALVGATVRALARGYGFTLTDPDSSVSDLLSEAHGLDRSLLGAELSAVQPVFLPADSRFGELDPSRLRQWASWEARFGIVAKPPNVAALFDGRFVPPPNPRVNGG